MINTQRWTEWDVSAVGGKVDDPQHIGFTVKAVNIIEAAQESDVELAKCGAGDYLIDSISIKP